MRHLIILFLMISFNLNAQFIFDTNDTLQKLVIVTIDGYRWQEIFKGADNAILENPTYVTNIPIAQYLFADTSVKIRRNKLTPFISNYCSANGVLIGNRTEHSFASVKNPYKISYPGYAEIFTGKVDFGIYKNKKKINHNDNFLHQISLKPNYKNSVAAFVSWETLPYIFNADQFNIPYNTIDINFNETVSSSLPNTFQCVDNRAGSTHFDALTFLMAKSYLQSKHPKVLYIGFGECDTRAHEKMYDQYLMAAQNIDKYIAELWYSLQSDAYYKDKTTLIITTDHGRGSGANNWYKHDMLTPGSGQTWMAILGPNTNSDYVKQLLSKSFKQTQIADIVNNIIN
jgi:Type I phosphodiesterase / nucleotide pyrophosphatase